VAGACYICYYIYIYARSRRRHRSQQRVVNRVNSFNHERYKIPVSWSSDSDADRARLLLVWRARVYVRGRGWLAALLLLPCGARAIGFFIFFFWQTRVISSRRDAPACKLKLQSRNKNQKAKDRSDDRALGPCLVPKEFCKILRLTITSNL